MLLDSEKSVLFLKKRKEMTALEVKHAHPHHRRSQYHCLPDVIPTRSCIEAMNIPKESSNSNTSHHLLQLDALTIHQKAPQSICIIIVGKLCVRGRGTESSRGCQKFFVATKKRTASTKKGAAQQHHAIQ